MQKTFNSFFINSLFIFLLGFHGLSYGEELYSEVEYLIRSAKPTKLTDPSLIFNATMLTSGSMSSPNIVFGTGIGSPVIDAWSMHSSIVLQLPINMQFSIPSDFKTEKPVSVELHFLVRKQSLENGNARIRINALYAHNESEFFVSNEMTFTHTNDSDDFEIVEPTESNELRHIFIDVPLEKSEIDRSDLALISFTRIEPEDTEYMGDIYLVAAVFRYTQK